MKLLDHQNRGVAFLKANSRAGLYDDPGLGKSCQALRAANEPCLVVAPAMILDGGVWADEQAKWAPGLDLTCVAYSQLSERERTPKGGSSPTGKLKAEYRRKWGTVIIDEAHYIKGRKSKWTKAVQQLQTERLYELTGTPIPNWAHEAFTLLQLLYPTEATPGGKFGSYWRWVEQWFTLNEQYSAGGIMLRSHVVGDLQPNYTWEQFRTDNWGERMLRRLREQCLDLPPLTETLITVHMKPAQKRAYNQIRKDFITWLDSGREISVWNQAAQSVRLAQCASGLEVLDSNEKPCSGKLDALQDLLTDRQLPTLVVGHFRNTIQACVQRAYVAGRQVDFVDGSVSSKQRGNIVRRFQAGTLNVLCATVDTISEGLTLTAADQIIRVERSYRPSRNTQARDRIYRLGQRRPVTCIDLVTADTIDQRVLGLLSTKTDQQMRALGDTELRQLV